MNSFCNSFDCLSLNPCALHKPELIFSHSFFFNQFPYKSRFVFKLGNHKYDEAARSLLTPKVGYGLASELRRDGVYVKTVEDKPQAADWALKRQMQHSMSSGIDWLFLVSDDRDFVETLRRANEANLGTVEVGDPDRALGRHADFWVPWIGVENEEITEKDLVPREREEEENDGWFSVSGFDREVDGVEDMKFVLDEFVLGRTEFGGMRISVFSEGKEDEEELEAENVNEDYFLEDSEDERYF